MKKTPLLPLVGTGLSGLVGSKFVSMFAKTYACTNLDLTVGVDITNESQVMKAIEKSPADVVIHFAAFTDATAAWQQTGDKNGLCYKVNVDGTRNIAKAARAFGKHCIHLSTAFVFDGEKNTLYTEDDATNPVEWYGTTKAMAEDIVQNTCSSWTIFRIDQPFRSDVFAKKPDTAHRLITSLTQGTLYPQFVDHWFSPTILEDFSRVLDWAVQDKPQGIFHATSGVKVSDFEYATMIKEALHLAGEVKQGKLAEYLRTLNRPYQRNTAMSSEKLKSETNIAFTPLHQALEQLKIVSSK